jgi:hypothetical protein
VSSQSCLDKVRRPRFGARLGLGDAEPLPSPHRTLLESSSYDLCSDMEEPNNDIDTETLQAQIDLSMAYTQNLVASWLPPTSGSLTQSSSRAAEAEAELQALLRRPPRCVFYFPKLARAGRLFELSFFSSLGGRLGVGAPLPETPAVAQARLMQKLEGGKKHSRGMENGATPVRTREDEKEADSGEESRAGTIRKRTRIDPFELGGKKKKKAVEMGMAKVVVAEDAPRLGTMAPVDAMAGPSPKRKKKKKKTLIPEDRGREERVTPGVTGGEGRPANLSANIAQREGSLQSLVEEWDGLWRYPQMGQSNASEASSSGMI